MKNIAGDKINKHLIKTHTIDDLNLKSKEIYTNIRNNIINNKYPNNTNITNITLAKIATKYSSQNNSLIESSLNSNTSKFKQQ